MSLISNAAGGHATSAWCATPNPETASTWRRHDHGVRRAAAGPTQLIADFIEHTDDACWDLQVYSEWCLSHVVEADPVVSTFVNVLVPAAASCAPASLRTASCGRSDMNLAIRALALAKADHTFWRPWQIQRRLPGPAIQLRRAGIFPRVYARAGATQILTSRGRWAIPRSQTAA